MYINFKEKELADKELSGKAFALQGRDNAKDLRKVLISDIPGSIYLQCGEQRAQGE